MLRRLLCDITNMCPEAWEGLCKTAALGMALALCALALTIYADGSGGLTREQLHITYALAEAPAGLFCLAAVGVVLIESRS